jgi:uncharacterized protein
MESNKKKKGFASLSPEKRKEIASKGGKAVHEKGNAHKFNSETARKAGKIGGKAVSENREHMANIGRKGGEASSASKGKRASNNGNSTEQDGTNG